MSYEHAASYLQKNGFSLPAAAESAHAWCLDLASAGDAEAQCVVSCLFATGLTGHKDEGLAHQWCKKAAANGSKDAQCALAAYLIRGVDEQPHEGVALLRRLANDGHLPAMLSLGLMMMSGLSIYCPKDEDAAIDLLLAPAQAGDPLSQCLVGSQLIASSDPARQQAGVKWITAAAEGGFSMAHRYLANFYRLGDYGHPIDEEKVAWHEAIAQRADEVGTRG